MKKRRFIRVLSLLLSVVLLFLSVPEVAWAIVDDGKDGARFKNFEYWGVLDSKNFGTGGKDSRGHMSNGWGTTTPVTSQPDDDEYPYYRFSDYVYDSGLSVNSDGKSAKSPKPPTESDTTKIDKNKTTGDNVEDNQPPDENSPITPQSGAMYSIPAIYVDVEFFDVSGLETNVKRYLAHEAKTSRYGNKAIKLVTWESIKKNGTVSLNEDRMREEVEKAGGYFIEDLFVDGKYESTLEFFKYRLLNDYSKSTSAQYNTTASSQAYYSVANTLSEVKIQNNPFTAATVGVISNIASGYGSSDNFNLAKFGEIPVILVYNGFFEYHNAACGDDSIFKTYGEVFGDEVFNTGFDTTKITDDVINAYVNTSNVSGSMSYGTAAGLAFNHKDASELLRQYYYNTLETKTPLAERNKITYDGQSYFGRTYLMYGGTPSTYGANTKFTFNVNSVSGQKYTNRKVQYVDPEDDPPIVKTRYIDGIDDGVAVQNYTTKAAGYYEIGLTESTNSAINAWRNWDIRIEMENLTYGEISEMNSYNKVWVTLPSTNGNKDAIYLYDRDAGSKVALTNSVTISPTSSTKYTITFKLTQDEMNKVLSGSHTICIYGTPKNPPSYYSQNIIFAPARFTIYVTNPSTNGAVMIQSSSNDDNPKMKVENTGTPANPFYRASSYLVWFNNRYSRINGAYTPLNAIDGPVIQLPNSSGNNSSSDNSNNIDDDNDTNNGSNNSSDSSVLYLSAKNAVINLDNTESITAGSLVLNESNSDYSIMPMSLSGSTPWSMKQTVNSAYAEVIANDVGYISDDAVKLKNFYLSETGRSVPVDKGWAQDWNVLGGIPSTENLAVAAGGSEYCVSAAGFIHTETDLIRHLSINATVTNGWGNGKSTPCTLSKHGTIFMCGSKHDCSIPNCEGEPCKKIVCTHQGCPKYNVVCDNTPPGHVDVLNADGSVKAGAHGEEASERHHDCTSYFAFNCAEKNTYDLHGGGDRSSSGQVISSVAHHGQGFNGSAKFKCNYCNKEYTDVCTSDLIDDGYIDKGFGNHCCGHTNLYHTRAATATVTWDEKIETASWREITSAKIWALGYSQIENVDTKLIDAKYNGWSSSNSNVMGYIWRGASSLEDGLKQKSSGYAKAGHLWYTQFVDINHTAGGGAWMSTSADNPLYWFGDVSINMQLMCDGDWISKNDGTYNDITQGRNISFKGGTRTDRGRSYGEFNHYADSDRNKMLDGTKQPDTWVGTDLPYGDIDYGQLGIIPVDAVNTWMSANMGYYKANIISDFIVMGISQGVSEMGDMFQNIVGDVHAVDANDGLPWFGIDGEAGKSTWKVMYPGKMSNTVTDSKYTDHVCRGGQAGSIEAGEFSVKTGDKPVVGGYTGKHNVHSTKGGDMYYYGAEGAEFNDWVKYKYTISAFFFTDKFTGMTGDTPPSSAGEPKWTCGNLQMPNKFGPPYGQWLWPDNETKYEVSYAHDDWNVDGRKGNPSNSVSSSAKNHSESSGYTQIHMVTNGRADSDSSRGWDPTVFQGYYREHMYPVVGKGMWLTSYTNKTQIQQLSDSKWLYQKIVEEDINNPGEYNSLMVAYDNYNKKWDGSYYQNALCMLDIDIKNTARNGYYNRPFDVVNYYSPMIFVDTPSVANGASNTCDTTDPAPLKCVYMNGFSHVNGVLIHNPISVEYSQVIGVNYTDKWDKVKDITNLDGRIYQNLDGSWSKLEENKKANYGIVGEQFHVWYTNFGDFFNKDGINFYYGPNRGAGTGGGLYISGLGEGSKMSVPVDDPKTGKRKTYAANSEQSKSMRGYQDSMDTSPWVYERLISFNFPVTYTNQKGERIAVGADCIINLDDIMAWQDTSSGYKQTAQTSKRYQGGDTNKIVNDSGSAGTSKDPFHYDKTLNDAYPDPTDGSKAFDKEFKWGADYSFTILPSAFETTSGEVTVYARSINAREEGETEDKGWDKTGGVYKSQQGWNWERRHEEYRADDCISKTMPIEIVGRIGNLVLTDVGDFRFSNLFKEVNETEWLIPGVIHTVNIDVPKVIFATNKDILGNDTRATTIKVKDNTNYVSHSTMSVTHLIIGSTGYGGKAAVWAGANNTMKSKAVTLWNQLPLTAAYNTVKEYKTEQMRMGYSALFDIETIGNYYGYNYKINKNDPEGPMEVDRGPTTAGEKDNRSNVMTISPKYYLYDFNGGTPNSQRWEEVAIYYGAGGNRKLFYDAGTTIENPDIENIYIDLGNGLDNEKGRRAVTKAEEVVTRFVTNKLANDTGDYTMTHSALEGKDFIGTPAKVVLDQYDRNFIGSNVLYGAIVEDSEESVGLKTDGDPYFDNIEKFNGKIVYNTDKDGNLVPVDGLQDTRFSNQSQRWYFSIELPSSAYITYPTKSDKVGGSRSQLDIEASHKELFEKHPNSVLICFLDIRVQGDVWTLQYDAKNMNGDSGYVEFDLFSEGIDPNPTDDSTDYNFHVVVNPSYIPNFDTKWQPAIVFDSINTSTRDWATAGTH